MTDNEILKWIASHMTKFNISIPCAEMEYINDEGFTFTVIIKDTDDMSDVDVLRQLVQQATEK